MIHSENLMSTLRKRLDAVWESPDLDAFFKKYSLKKPIRIKKGNNIFYEGEETTRLFYIKKGFIKLYQSAEDGHEPVVYLYGPQSLLGLRALTAKDQAYWHTCEALTDCEVVAITTDEYKDVLAAHPEYMIDLLQMFIQRLNYTERRLFGFVTAETTTRVSAFLYDCMLRFGIKKGNKTLIPVPLTHQLISEFVGAARESITISMNKLVKQGVITHARGEVSVLDGQKLKVLAGIN